MPAYGTRRGIPLPAVPGKNGLPLATAASRVDLPSRGVDRSESTLMGMGKVTGGVFRVYSTGCFRDAHASSSGAMSNPGDPLMALSGCGSTHLGMRIVTGGDFR